MTEEKKVLDEKELDEKELDEISGGFPHPSITVKNPFQQ
jgi:bacteriocin-like protein